MNFSLLRSQIFVFGDCFVDRTTNPMDDSATWLVHHVHFHLPPVFHPSHLLSIVSLHAFDHLKHTEIHHYSWSLFDNRYLKELFIHNHIRGIIQLIISTSSSLSACHQLTKSCILLPSHNPRIQVVSQVYILIFVDTNWFRCHIYFRPLL